MKKITSKIAYNVFLHQIDFCHFANLACMLEGHKFLPSERVPTRAMASSRWRSTL